MLLIVMLLSCGAIAASAYRYAYAHEYDFLVEVPCDESAQICHLRDCDTEECPPNELSSYTILRMSAREASACVADGTCEARCDTLGSACIEESCDASDPELACSTPPRS